MQCGNAVEREFTIGELLLDPRLKAIEIMNSELKKS